MHKMLRQASVWLEILSVFLIASGIMVVFIILDVPPFAGQILGFGVAMLIVLRMRSRYRQLYDETNSGGLCLKCGYPMEPNWPCCTECGRKYKTGVRS